MRRDIDDPEYQEWSVGGYGGETAEERQIERLERQLREAQQRIADLEQDRREAQLAVLDTLYTACVSGAADDPFTALLRRRDELRAAFREERTR